MGTGAYSSASYKGQVVCGATGKARVTTCNDEGSVIESLVLCQVEGRYGVDTRKGAGINWRALSLTP